MDPDADLARTSAPPKTWVRKSRELYFLLKLKLNVHGADLCKDTSDHNDVEISRSLSCSYDPHSDGQDMALFD